jgi:hypothetical protein
MNSKRLYFTMLGAIGVLTIGLLGGAYTVNKLLDSQSRQLIDERKQVKVLDAEQTELAKAKQDIKKYNELADIAKSVVPQDKDQAQAVRQIVDIANANGVALSSITFPASSLATKGKVQLSQLLPVKGISGVYSLQLTVQSDQSHPVPYNQFINFLASLEHNRRTALVSSITIQPNSKDRSTLSFTLVLNEYIKP